MGSNYGIMRFKEKVMKLFEGKPDGKLSIEEEEELDKLTRDFWSSARYYDSKWDSD